MSSAAMASSSVSQEELENDFEKSSRRSRIRMARGRDVRGQQTAATACRMAAAETLAEADDGAEGRPLDASGYSGDHDASPKPTTRSKEKRPIRPPHIVKGKQQRDRRKLREKRRSTGVVHMPSTEVSSTGGSTNEDDEDLSGPEPATAGAHPHPHPHSHGAHAHVHVDTRRHEPAGDAPSRPSTTDQFQSALRNKSLSDLDADDEDNQDCDSLGTSDAAGPAGAIEIGGASVERQPASPPGVATAPAPGDAAGAADPDKAAKLAGENARLRRALAERDQRIAGLEAQLNVSRHEKQRLRHEKDGLERAIAALRAQ